ncbi:MAG: CHRD domain-containing protein [Euzebya sp.]
MSRTTIAALILALVVLATACASDDPAVETAVSDSPATPADAGVVDAPTAADAGADPAGEFAADLTLTGDAEVPGPGADASADVTLTISGGQACLTGDAADVGAIQAGHIHEGDAETAGGVVVDLGVTTDDSGAVDSCGDIDDATASAVAADPANFYVNLHTADFPDGAVRVQIG